MPWPPPSTLPDTPFPNRPVAAVAAVAEALLTPAYWTLDRLLALQPTTDQQSRWRRWRGGHFLAVAIRVLVAPALVLALVLALLPAVLGLLLWLPAQAKRRPFVHQFSAAAATPEPWDPRCPRGLTFLTANVCLLPSGLARFSNLGSTGWRAEVIGQILAAVEYCRDRDGLLDSRSGRGGGYGGTLSTGVGPGVVDEGSAVVSSTAWPEMAMGDPTLMVNPTPMTNTMVWPEMPVANPTPMTTSTPMTNTMAWPEIPMGDPTPVTNSTLMTNPTMTNPTMTNLTAMTNPKMTNPTMTNPTAMTNPTMTNPSPVTTPTPCPERPISLPDPMPPVLTARIPPDVDFLCLQEVFDVTAATALRRHLGRRFPHLLWGVGPAGLRCGRLRLMGSGLLLASRFPLLAASFWPFPQAAREDALANKGLLVAQVLLGTGRGRRVVGYLGCTHLQATAADATIRDKQLSLSLRWLKDFRRQQEQPGDLVAFDVLCGDLNFDNCSRGDAQNQCHPLFQEFWDPARRGRGQEQPWAIGTLLNYLKIYEEPVSDPETMRRTLSEPWGRQQYLAGPILSCGATDPSVTEPWSGRRVDMVLLRRDPEVTTEVTRYSVITRLATLSDHLPVAVQLRLGPADR